MGSFFSQHRVHMMRLKREIPSPNKKTSQVCTCSSHHSSHCHAIPGSFLDIVESYTLRIHWSVFSVWKWNNFVFKEDKSPPRGHFHFPLPLKKMDPPMGLTVEKAEKTHLNLTKTMIMIPWGGGFIFLKKTRIWGRF